MGTKVKKGIKIFFIILWSAAFVFLAYEYVKEKMRLAQEAYYTEFKLTNNDLMQLNYAYRIKTTVEWETLLDEQDTWPDFSHYTLEATAETEMVVEILNYYLFVDVDEEDENARDYAEKHGITMENPMTVEWVMKHPVEALSIRVMLKRRGHYTQQGSVQSEYEYVMEQTGRGEMDTEAQLSEE